MAVQSRVNGQLGAATSEPLVAAGVSFSVGLVALTAAACVPSPRRGLTALFRSQRTGRIRWWECLGGVIGGLFVAAQTSTVAALGVAGFTILVVGAQTVAAMLVDHLGIGPRGRTQVTLRRLVGGLIAVIGVALSAFAGHGSSGTFALAAAVVAFLAGAATQLQQALNGRVAKETSSAYATTWQNFVVGLLALGVILLTKIVAFSGTFDFPHGVQPWHFTGGLLGIGFIGMSAWATRHISVLELGLTVLLGQLVMALLLDVVDASARAIITPLTLLGTVVTLLGAWVAASGSTRRR